MEPHTDLLRLAALIISIMFLRCIHVVAYISTSLIFMVEYYFLLWIYHILFIHISVMDI